MTDAPTSIARRISELASADPDAAVYRHVAIDGPDTEVDWVTLHRRSSQLAGALAARGVGCGDRLTIGLRNSPQFALSTLAAWKLGAVPVPVRWDVPDWELDRIREVIQPAVHLGPADVFPAEVELALVDHPRIADVVVIGLKDDDWGRRVHAVIQPVDPADAPTLEEIRTFAKTRLASYKVPKTLEVVEAIPRSEATKINRGKLIDERGG